jgi:hypothetical protein
MPEFAVNDEITSVRRLEVSDVEDQYPWYANDGV